MTVSILAILLPFLGTVLGAGGALFMGRALNPNVSRCLTGFAGGVMVAASIWSLIMPAIEQSAAMGIWAFLPAALGVWGGFLGLLVLDHRLPHLHRNSQKPEGIPGSLGKSTMLVMAVALHNLPEGMAVGVVLAGWLTGSGISAAAVVTLALGIAIQNLPEGAIISMPLRSEGMSKSKAFRYGVLSGVVEPLGAIATLALAEMVVPVLPYLLSFSAGAMLYVVVEELIPEFSGEPHSDLGVVSFAAGFTLMMALDVALG